MPCMYGGLRAWLKQLSIVPCMYARNSSATNFISSCGAVDKRCGSSWAQVIVSVLVQFKIGQRFISPCEKLCSQAEKDVECNFIQKPFQPASFRTTPFYPTTVSSHIPQKKFDQNVVSKMQINPKRVHPKKQAHSKHFHELLFLQKNIESNSSSKTNSSTRVVFCSPSQGTSSRAPKICFPQQKVEHPTNVHFSNCMSVGSLSSGAMHQCTRLQEVCNTQVDVSAGDTLIASHCMSHTCTTHPPSPF